ncbi:HD-GYP domain-containing protein [Pseudomonas gingeri]|uniref:HD-GYP domain-containing protein n=1 Tax=Pseudomonas gingeri TaxID=117681 RepID=A0A7Y7X7M8_9PSED|nr:HD-GYP domain-containing protein [Pseudomonas gingeri]NWA23839.1 HD-GYP domain-containing protein [Pseudomonas gingeri]NWB94739.1 HD-GYP domain-containing protein [Pseudomonas gingeri]NWD68063.1 HD-GYP domain-containing protein [Pseudomonas gingeri]NWD73850.1 HD-GYP domain-containing protein [Pseudomonas gingeri]
MDPDICKGCIKIEVAQLAIGMQIEALDRPWEETTFSFREFRIRREEELRLLRENCEYVWVDIASASGRQAPPVETPAECAALAEPVDFNVEMAQAERAWGSARAQSWRILEAVELGEAIQVGAVKAVVKDCVDSILRNPSALLWLTRIKFQDDYTAEHSLRVAMLSIALGRELGLPAAELEEIGVGAMLHDVGKLKVPGEILNKPTALSEQEYAIMKSHPMEGYTLLVSQSGVPLAALDVALSHHERIDGTGYPQGLSAEAIPLYARIVAVTDAYDAISSDRVYSKGRSTLESLRILFKAANSHFDEQIVSAFIRMIGLYPSGEIVEMTNEEVAIILGAPTCNRLKPRLLRVLGADKRRCLEKVIDLAGNTFDAMGRPYAIRQVCSSGAFGVDIESYRRRGLIQINGG